MEPGIVTSLNGGGGLINTAEQIMHLPKIPTLCTIVVQLQVSVNLTFLAIFSQIKFNNPLKSTLNLAFSHHFFQIFPLTWQLNFVPS